MTSNQSTAARDVFAKNVRNVRLEKGISQERLGELAGFHRTYVSQVERGVSNVSLDNAQRLAEKLETELWLLLKP
jgi:transcriptional regulator with XRE-family HTH domain